MFGPEVPSGSFRWLSYTYYPTVRVNNREPFENLYRGHIVQCHYHGDTPPPEPDPSPPTEPSTNRPPEPSTNRPPEVVRRITDKSFPRTGIDRTSPEAWSIRNDLSDNFRDPDGDDLTYRATSSDTDKATASLSGSTLTVTGVAEGGEGTATIRVTASDGKGDGTASFSFTVTLGPQTTTIIINEQTLRIDDPLSQVDFAAVLKKVADVASGQIVKSKATRRTSTSPVVRVIDEVVEEAEMVVEEIEYELDRASYISAAADLLIRGEVRTFIQNELDERTGTEEYTVHLEKKPEGNVEVRITSSHPDTFVITPETLTFTPDNYNSPQTVRVRPAFTVANYVDGTVPDLSTLSHSASSVGAPEEVQIGVIGSQPISEHVSSALVQIVEEIGLYDLFCLIPKARVVCSVVSLGQRIAGVIEDAVEFAQQIGQQISDGLEPFFGDDEAVEAAKAYEEGGTAGLTDHVDEQLASSEVDPVASVSTQPVVAVQSRLGARSAPGGGSAVGNSDLSFLDQVLERSAHFLVTHQQEFNAGGFDIHHALSLVGTDFKVPLSSLGIAQQDAATGAAASATRNMVLWGSVDYSQFGDSADNFSIDGANWTFTVGVDGHLKPDLLAGVALSRSSARSDYDYFGAAMGGDHDVNLTVFSPYLNWFASDQLGLWASVGYGKGSSRFSLSRIGDLDLSSIEGLDQSATRKEQDSDFFSLSTGLRWEAFRAEATQVSFKLAGSTTTFLERDSQQGRIAAQVAREFPSPNGVLSSSLDLAMLLASTDSAAMEVVAGLDWAAANDKFSASTVARSLVFSGDRYEWGLGAALNYQAGVRPGEGLSLSLKPTFGVTASHLTELDIFSPSEDGELAFQPWQPSARLNARLDYGIPSGAALLTPYTEFSMSHNSTVYGAGLRYALDTSLDLDLSASRRSRASGTNDNRLFLQLRSDL